MINISLDELKLVAKNRNIRDYENKSKKDLIKALSKPKPKMIVLIMMIVIFMIIIMILLMMMNIEKLEALEDYLKSLIEIITNP